MKSEYFGGLLPSLWVEQSPFLFNDQRPFPSTPLRTQIGFLWLGPRGQSAWVGPLAAVLTGGEGKSPSIPKLHGGFEGQRHLEVEDFHGFSIAIDTHDAEIGIVGWETNYTNTESVLSIACARGWRKEIELNSGVTQSFNDGFDFWSACLILQC